MTEDAFGVKGLRIDGDGTVTAPGCAGSEKATGKMKDYRGCQTKTITGRTCKKWSSTLRRYGGLAGGHNFCRNPYGKEKMWCYTEDPGPQGCRRRRRPYRWDFCEPLTADYIVKQNEAY